MKAGKLSKTTGARAVGLIDLIISQMQDAKISRFAFATLTQRGDGLEKRKLFGRQDGRSQLYPGNLLSAKATPAD